MRMRQVVFGLYIGDEIRLFYDNGDNLPTSVMQIDIDTEATDGWKFIDFFARSMFSYERIKAFCSERYKDIHSGIVLDSFADKLAENASEAIKSLLYDYFVTSKKCDETATNRFLETFRFQVANDTKESKEETESAVMPSETVSRYVLKKQGRSHKKGRDTTKYSIDGGMNYFGKGKFVREIVAAYLSAHPSITFVQLEQIFPDELQGSYGVVRRLDDIYNSDHNLKDLLTRYVMDEDKLLRTKDGVRFAVCNQWGSFNFPHILDLLDKWGWNVLNDKE